jgi:hypothetical protein
VATSAHHELGHGCQVAVVVQGFPAQGRNLIDKVAKDNERASSLAVKDFRVTPPSLRLKASYALGLRCSLR